MIDGPFSLCKRMHIFTYIFSSSLWFFSECLNLRKERDELSPSCYWKVKENLRNLSSLNLEFKQFRKLFCLILFHFKFIFFWRTVLFSPEIVLPFSNDQGKKVKFSVRRGKIISWQICEVEISRRLNVILRLEEHGMAQLNIHFILCSSFFHKGISYILCL